MNVLREWKKVYEGDLDSIIFELKDFLTTPAVVILSGDIGVGKTTFTKSFIKSLNINETTVSPTYSVVNEVGEMVHADFYRLKSAEEIVHLELPMYLEEKDYFFVEWGKPYLKQLHNEVPREFSFFELLFEMNETLDGHNVSSRNLQLIDLPNN